MCLRLTFSSKRKLHIAMDNPSIAYEDIHTFKVIQKNGSPIYNYTPGFKWRKGWHYYQTGNKKFTYEIVTGFFGQLSLDVHEGLHSVVSPGFAGIGEKVIETIIPKGAQYYTDGYYYVSSELIYP